MPPGMIKSTLQGGSRGSPSVVLGVTASISAYKAVEVCRMFTARGARVLPVMTADARRFVGDLTFSALASEPVPQDLFDAVDPSPHTRLAREADIVVVAPATAHLLGAYACGLCDDLLTATLLATRAPVLLCPAMHSEMWESAAVKENVARLRSRGVMVLDPASGPLAGGDDGVGRLVEPALIVDAAIEMLALSQRKRFVSPQSSGVSSELLGSLATKKDMAGVKVLVSAGGTREPIDPVRFISNRSSGKQGYALALEALLRGAEVTVVTAAEGIDPPAGTEVVRVETVAEMEREMTSRARAADVVVMAAAVSDFRPSKASSEKLSRAQGPVELVLEPAPDILSELVRLRRPNQVIVGFAAETADVLDRGRAKLEAKGVDLMVANDVSLPGVGFGWDTNAVEIILPGGSSKSVPLTTKAAVARAVFDSVVERMEASVVKRLEATGADLGSAAPRCTSPAMSSKEES